MRIILQSSYTSLPWKNGGGVTNEALREPPGTESYRWRVSVAEIGAPGPFSSFSEYHRTMTLLAGGGVKLSFADGGESYLRDVGDLVVFDGAIPTQCELLAGACTDLNLIVAKTMGKTTARVESAQSPQWVVSEIGRTTLLFAVRGSFFLAGDGSSGTLQPWDMAVLEPGDAIRLTPTSVDRSQLPLVFFASLDDNR